MLSYNDRPSRRLRLVEFEVALDPFQETGNRRPELLGHAYSPLCETESDRIFGEANEPVHRISTSPLKNIHLLPNNGELVPVFLVVDLGNLLREPFNLARRDLDRPDDRVERTDVLWPAHELDLVSALCARSGGRSIAGVVATAADPWMVGPPTGLAATILDAALLIFATSLRPTVATSLEIPLGLGVDGWSARDDVLACLYPFPVGLSNQLGESLAFLDLLGHQ